MALRCRALAIAIAITCACFPVPAHAEPRADIAAKTRAAMASYDAMDYEAARRLLYQALALAKRARLDRDPLVARVYLDLGIAQLAVADPEAAKVSFLSAVQIDPKITVEPAYKSSEVVRLLDDARAVAGDSEPVSEECKLRGIQRAVLADARPGVAQPVEVVVGGEPAPARVVVMYRPQDAIDFTEARLSRQAGCRYTGTIPAAAMRGALVHYYIAVYDASNRVLAAKGSSATPSVLSLATPGAAIGAARAPGNPPPAGPPAAPAPPPAPLGVAREAPVPRGPRRVAAMFVGTGIGYVSGKTEGENVVQTCCLGTSAVVLGGELRYQLSERWSLAAVGRLGLPLGANITGHSTIAPAGFVRVGYTFGGPIDGLHVMAELGAGILRNTIKLTTQTPGMDTDIVAQGPLLAGAGVGYAWRLGRMVAMLVDVDAIAGLAVADKLGSAIHLNTGISGDMRVGVAVAF